MILWSKTFWLTVDMFVVFYNKNGWPNNGDCTFSFFASFKCYIDILSRLTKTNIYIGTYR